MGLISEKNAEKRVRTNTHGITALASTHQLHLKVKRQAADLKVSGPIFYTLYTWEMKKWKIFSVQWGKNASVSFLHFPSILLSNKPDTVYYEYCWL